MIMNLMTVSFMRFERPARGVASVLLLKIRRTGAAEIDTSADHLVGA
jgi:hypothetical protein